MVYTMFLDRVISWNNHRCSRADVLRSRSRSFVRLCCSFRVSLPCKGQSRTVVIPINPSGSQGLGNVNVAPIDQVARTTIKKYMMKIKHCDADASGNVMLQ